MKKLVSIFLSLLLAFCSFSFVAFGASISGNYTYTVTNKTYTTITKFNSKVSGDVAVPDKVGGYYVTHVGDGAFYWCYNITSITLPKRVTYIGDKAFEYCSKMKNISLPEGVTYIGDSAFEDCIALQNIDIPPATTIIADWAFDGCDSLKSVDIPNSVTSLGDYAFFSCNSLQTVTIGDGVTSIGEKTFAGCASMKSVTIPETVTEISDDAFLNCNKDVVIVGYVGSYAHSYAQSKNIKFEQIETDDHTHAYVCKVLYKPTCDNEGLEVYTCICEDSYTQRLAPLGHKIKTVGKKSATYFAKGYTGDKKCSVCGKVTAKGKAVAQLKLKTPKFSLKGATKKFTVKYTKVTGATGFEVRYKLGSGKYKTVKVNTKKSMSKVISKLKKGKYTVQVRAFVKSGSKTAYSSWASAKKVTVK